MTKTTSTPSAPFKIPPAVEDAEFHLRKRFHALFALIDNGSEALRDACNAVAHDEAAENFDSIVYHAHQVHNALGTLTEAMRSAD